MPSNKPVAQTPQCIGPISHNAPFCNRNVLQMVHCGVFDALWVVWDESYWHKNNILLFLHTRLQTYYGMALFVRPSARPFVRSSVRPVVSTKKHGWNRQIFFSKFSMQMYLGVPPINSWLVWSYFIIYAHNDIISDFCILGNHGDIF